MSHSFVERALRWMNEEALPLWSTSGVDKAEGGFFEALRPDGSDAGMGFKRTRVMARQVYVFSHAYTLGFNCGRDIAMHGLEFMKQKAWQGPKSGYAKVLSDTGHVLDGTPDLYDNAFAILALSWLTRIDTSGVARDWLYRSMDFIEATFTHPAGGYWHQWPAVGWRVQNPHMHLTEACLAAYEATGDKRFARVATDLVELFSKRLFRQKGFILPENYKDDWEPAAGLDGSFFEPGHVFEWAWILQSSHRLLGLDVMRDAKMAASVGEQLGINPATRATYNKVANSGDALDRTSRLWTNTERLKACLAMHEAGLSDGVSTAEEVVVLLQQHFFSNGKPGLWIDVLDAEGARVPGVAPASSLYHIFLAYSELKRVFG
jgi:mannose/cellobiose epimerase-like protein (N-acyl-D-glucosamine 2-epimerase family)